MRRVDWPDVMRDIMKSPGLTFGGFSNTSRLIRASRDASQFSRLVANVIKSTERCANF
jgi:hypothetical protein